VDNIFERSIWYGTNAERLAFTPDLDGTVFFETDTDTAYWWEGGAWHSFGSGGGGVGPPTEGPGIDIVGLQVGLGGDTVLLYDDGGNPVAEYATITLALAAAAVGNLVWVPQGVFTEDITIPAGVTVASLANGSIIAGAVTLAGDDSHIKGMIIQLVGDSAGALVGITGPATGVGLINDCSVSVTNNGAGDAIGVMGDDGDMRSIDCICDITTNGGGDAIGFYSASGKVGEMFPNNSTIDANALVGGDGYGFATDGGNIWATDGQVRASTAPVRV